MGLYALGQRTSATASGAASWEVRSSAGTKMQIQQMGCTQVTAVAGTYGIGRPAAIGITPTSPQTFVDESDGGTVHGTFAPASTVSAAVAWGTGPTVPANFNRRFTAPATIGQGFLEVFPRGLGVPVSSSIVIWLLATAPVCDAYAVVNA